MATFVPRGVLTRDFRGDWVRALLLRVLDWERLRVFFFYGLVCVYVLEACEGIF